MPFRFVYRPADISAASRILDSADKLLALRYKHVNGTVREGRKYIFAHTSVNATKAVRSPGIS